MPTPCSSCPQTERSPSCRAFSRRKSRRSMPAASGQIVVERFLQDRGLRHAEAAERARGGTVGVHRAGVGAVVRGAVGAGGVDRDADGDGRTPAGIGAGVEIAVEPHGGDAGPRVAADAGGHCGGVALGRRLHRFATGCRSSGTACRSSARRGRSAVAATRRAWSRSRRPPAAGMMRTFSGGRPRTRAVSSRSMTGAWVQAWMHQRVAVHPCDAGLGLDIGVFDVGGVDVARRRHGPPVQARRRDRRR